MANKIKIVYMGTPQAALPPLESLYNDEKFEILAVISQPDKKVGRKQKITGSPVKIWAQEHHLPVLTPPTLKNNVEFLNLLSNLNPDLLVVTAYGNILPKEILKVPKYGAVNVHFSLLPKYRGASPVEESIKNDDSETGVTIMQMDEKMDTGAIIHLERILIDEKDTTESLKDKLAKVAYIILPAVLKDYVKGILTPLPQNEAKATYTRKISKEMGLLDIHDLTAKQAYNRIRAYFPWPNCYLQLNTKKLKILSAMYDEKIALEPGQIAIVNKKQLAIGTKKGTLYPIKVQLEGKKEMEIQDFLAGNLNLLKNELSNPM
jgi:methionyl-tRNA formyltransferase